MGQVNWLWFVSIPDDDYDDYDAAYGDGEDGSDGDDDDDENWSASGSSMFL